MHTHGSARQSSRFNGGIEMSIIQKPSALEKNSSAADHAATIGLPAAAEPTHGPLADPEDQLHTAQTTPRRDHKRSTRLRRTIDRLRQDRDTPRAEASGDEVAELKLELLLLGEENARLKADRHRPPDLGTLIDYLRFIGDPAVNLTTLDDAWSVLSDCLAIREALTQAYRENQTAIRTIEQHLRDAPQPTADISPLSISSLTHATDTSEHATPDGLASAA
jgi:hypothetical protein